MTNMLLLIGVERHPRRWCACMALLTLVALERHCRRWLLRGCHAGALLPACCRAAMSAGEAGDNDDAPTEPNKCQLHLLMA